jgi:hypothetical protein
MILFVGATASLVAGLASSLLGTGMSIAQLVQANKQKKAAQSAAAAAKQQFMNVKEKDAFADVQVPTLGYDLARQQLDRQTQAATKAAQGAGAEGVIGAMPGIVQAGSEAGLNVAAQQEEAASRIKLAGASAKAEAEGRRALAERQFYADELTGAQTAAAAAQANKNAAIEGIFSSVGGGIEAGMGAASLYGNKSYNKAATKASQGVSAFPLTEEQYNQAVSPFI